MEKLLLGTACASSGNPKGARRPKHQLRVLTWGQGLLRRNMNLHFPLEFLKYSATLMATDPGSTSASQPKTLRDPTVGLSTSAAAGTVLPTGESKWRFPPNPPAGLPPAGATAGLPPPPPSCSSSDSSSKGLHATSSSRPSPSSAPSSYSSRNSQEHKDLQLTLPAHDPPGGGSIPAASAQIRSWHFFGNTVGLPAQFISEWWSGLGPINKDIPVPRGDPRSSEHNTAGRAEPKATRPADSAGVTAVAGGDAGTLTARSGKDSKSSFPMGNGPSTSHEQASGKVSKLGSQAASIASIQQVASGGAAGPVGPKLVDGLRGLVQHSGAWVFETGSRAADSHIVSQAWSVGDAALARLKMAVQQTQQGALTWAAKAGNLVSAATPSKWVAPAGAHSGGPPTRSWSTTAAAQLEYLSSKARELKEEMLVVLDHVAPPAETFSVARTRLAQALRPFGALVQTFGVETARRMTQNPYLAVDKTAGLSANSLPRDMPKSWGFLGLNLEEIIKFPSTASLNISGDILLRGAVAIGIVVCLLLGASLARR